MFSKKTKAAINRKKKVTPAVAKKRKRRVKSNEVSSNTSSTSDEESDEFDEMDDDDEEDEAHHQVQQDEVDSDNNDDPIDEKELEERVRAYKARQLAAKERILSKKLGLLVPSTTNSDASNKRKSPNKSSDGDEIELIQSMDHRPVVTPTQRAQHKSAAASRHARLSSANNDAASHSEHHPKKSRHGEHSVAVALSSEASAVANIFASMKKRVVVVADVDQANQQENADALDAAETRSSQQLQQHRTSKKHSHHHHHHHPQSSERLSSSLMATSNGHHHHKTDGAPAKSGSPSNTDLHQKSEIDIATKPKVGRKPSSSMSAVASAKATPKQPCEIQEQRDEENKSPVKSSVSSSKVSSGSLPEKRGVQTRSSNRLISRS